MLSAKEINDTLAGFTGTDSYYKFHALIPRAVLTEGTHYLAEAAGCYWLMQDIALYQSVLARRYRYSVTRFQTWTLTVKNGKGTLTCTDGNGNKLLVRRIPHTDFPLSACKLYVSLGELTVIMLPSEY